MLQATHLIELLTVRRISQLSNRPVSIIEQLLDEHPDIKPTAVADHRPVFDRTAYLRIIAALDQADAEAAQ